MFQVRLTHHVERIATKAAISQQGTDVAVAAEEHSAQAGLIGDRLGGP